MNSDARRNDAVIAVCADRVLAVELGVRLALGRLEVVLLDHLRFLEGGERPVNRVIGKAGRVLGDSDPLVGQVALDGVPGGGSGNGHQDAGDHRDDRSDARRPREAALYARLSTAEQNRVFQKHSGRRIVLATNVAESSLTVPGIRYVVDTGHGPHQPLFGPQQVAAAADRGDFAGLGRPAQGPLRPRRAGRLHPAVQRRRLSGPRAVHVAGNPADEPGRGDPAASGARSGVDRRVSVSRSAAGRSDSRRLQDAVRAGGRRRGPAA